MMCNGLFWHVLTMPKQLQNQPAVEQPTANQQTNKEGTEHIGNDHGPCFLHNYLFEIVLEQKQI